MHSQFGGKWYNGHLISNVYKYPILGRFEDKKRAPLLANFQSFNSHKFLCSLAHKLVNLERIYCVVSCELSFANSRENTTPFVIVLVKWNLLVELKVRCNLFERKIYGDNKSGV